jgi:hypothetical protein
MTATENGSAGPPAEEGSGGMEEASHLLDTLGPSAASAALAFAHRIL